MDNVFQSVVINNPILLRQWLFHVKNFSSGPFMKVVRRAQERSKWGGGGGKAGKEELIMWVDINFHSFTSYLKNVYYV